MYKLIEYKKTGSLFCLYKNDDLIKESFNINVIKAILKSKFSKVYDNRKILVIGGSNA